MDRRGATPIGFRGGMARARRRWRPGGRTACAVVAALLGASLGAPAYSQPRTRVAVTAFENKVRMPWWDASWRIGEGLAEMLTTELLATGRFVVVERQAAADVVGEQALAQSGLVRRETGAPTGQLLGAQYVVRGAITQFEEQASGGSVGMQTNRAAIAGRASNGHVGLDIRLIDTTSGQIVASRHVAVAVPGAGASLSAMGRQVTFGGDAFYQTPLGQATRSAVQQAVLFIAATTPAPSGAPTSWALVKVDGRTAYVNAGTGAVRVGDVLRVYSRGEDLTDPSTGQRLGAVERAVGTLEVVEVHEQFSVGTIQSSTGAMKRGDAVRVR